MGEEENNRDSPMSGEEATTDLTVVTRLYDTNRTIREVILYIHFTYVIGSFSKFLAKSVPLGVHLHIVPQYYEVKLKRCISL